MRFMRLEIWNLFQILRNENIEFQAFESVCRDT